MSRFQLLLQILPPKIRRRPAGLFDGPPAPSFSKIELERGASRSTLLARGGHAGDDGAGDGENQVSSELDRGDVGGGVCKGVVTDIALFLTMLARDYIVFCVKGF